MRGKDKKRAWSWTRLEKHHLRRRQEGVRTCAQTSGAKETRIPQAALRLLPFATSFAALAALIVAEAAAAKFDSIQSLV